MKANKKRLLLLLTACITLLLQARGQQTPTDQGQRQEHERVWLSKQLGINATLAAQVQLIMQDYKGSLQRLLKQPGFRPQDRRQGIDSLIGLRDVKLKAILDSGELRRLGISLPKNTSSLTPYPKTQAEHP